MLKCFILILGFRKHPLWIMASPKFKNKLFENGSSETLKMYYIFTSFNQKGSFFFFNDEILYLERKNALLKNIGMAQKITCIFRVFLEWLNLELHCSSMLLIIVLITVLMECLQTGTHRALALDGCK